MSDSQLLEMDDETDTFSNVGEEIVEFPPASKEIAGGSECPSCHEFAVRGEVPICQSCGYYPSLGTFVELEDWERQGAEAQVLTKTSHSHLEIWANLIPGWAWALIAIHTSILGISIAARLLVPEGTARMMFSLSQLGIGFLVAMLSHFITFLNACSENVNIGMLDFFLKPLKIWIPILQQLPKTFYRVAFGTGGVTAMLGALLIVGAIPYEILLDWGIKEPPKKNLMGAIMDQVQKVDGDGNNLEEAIGDFAGKAGNMEDDANNSKPAKDVIKPRIKMDCLILGYSPTKDFKGIQTLVLAREFQGKLKVIGRVSPKFSEDKELEMIQQFNRSTRPSSLVSTSLDANWLKPVFTCRISYTEARQDGTLQGMVFETMLKELD